jgi:hypothetical protein
MCSAKNPISVMRHAHGKFTLRAHQASDIMLELEKARRNMPVEQNSQRIINQALDFCDAAISGLRQYSQQAPYESLDDVVLYQALGGIVTEQRVQSAQATLRLMVNDRQAVPPPGLEAVQVFFLEGLEALNSARRSNPS